MFGTASFSAAVTVAPLIAVDITGSTALSGLPGAAIVAGTAVGATLLSSIARRRGSRTGLGFGYLVGSVAAVAAVIATAAAGFWGLIVSMLVMGVGHSANQLARYVAADAYAPHRRASVLSWVVWAGTIGALSGPPLVGLFGQASTALGLPLLAGGYLLSSGAFAAAAGLSAFSARRAAPAIQLPRPRSELEPVRALRSSASEWRRPRVRIALVALVAGYLVMMLVMTMTPVHVRRSGEDLASLGIIMGMHVVGMGGLAPVAGWMSDRFGSLPVILAGKVLLAVAAVSAALVPPSAALFAAVLFLLGVGWSAGFVAASALLVRGLPASEQTTIRGRVEAATWAVAAMGSVASGVLMGVAGYLTLTLVAASLLVLPLVFVASQYGRIGSQVTN
jgi:MFS family permease